MNFVDEEDGAPAEPPPGLASDMTARISLMPESTALKEMK
jgi:hypothetical protein